jgi:hypothetical protein
MNCIYNTYSGGSCAADASKAAYSAFTASRMDGGTKKRKKQQKQQKSNPSKEHEQFTLGVIHRPNSQERGSSNNE